MHTAHPQCIHPAHSVTPYLLSPARRESSRPSRTRWGACLSVCLTTPARHGTAPYRTFPLHGTLRHLHGTPPAHSHTLPASTLQATVAIQPTTGVGCLTATTILRPRRGSGGCYVCSYEEEYVPPNPPPLIPITHPSLTHFDVQPSVRYTQLK